MHKTKNTKVSYSSQKSDTKVFESRKQLTPTFYLTLEIPREYFLPPGFFNFFRDPEEYFTQKFFNL